MRLPTVLIALTVIARSALSQPPLDHAQICHDLEVSTCQLALLEVPADLPTQLTVMVPLDGEDAALVLARHSLRAPSFRAYSTARDGSLVPVEPPAPRTYRGDLLLTSDPSSPSGTVAASLTDAGLTATIRDLDGAVWCVQPLSDVVPGAGPQLHVVYRAEDTLPGDFTCGVLDAPVVKPHGDGLVPAGTVKMITEIAFDADVEFYNQNGGSVTSTITDIENVMNAVEAIYENDLDITYALTAVIVRTSEPDPYDVTDPGSLLNQFRQFWNANHKDIRRDITHFMTGKNLDGSTIGIASLGVVCQAGYGLSQSKFTGNFTSRVGLTAHELGHNWSSPHCSGGGCFIMCPSLGGCGPVTQFGTSAKNTINSYKNAVNCLENDSLPLPPPFFDDFAGPTLEPSYWSANGSADDVLTSALNEPSPPYSLRLESTGSGANQQGQIESVEIDLLGDSDATLAFYSQHRGVESGKSLVVEYRSVSQVWTEIDRVVSNGVDQSDFELRSHPLPADAQHSQFRLRFRVEGTSTTDDWFVDNISVGPPPPGPPAITGISGSVQVLFGDTVQVTGDNFETPGLTVTVGGQSLIPYFEYFVVDNQHIDLKPPSLPAIGSTDVVISNSKGTTAPFPLNVIPTSPPRMIATGWMVNGQSIDLLWGGTPGDLAFLLVGITNNTIPFAGQSMLDFSFLLPRPPLDVNGLGSLTAPVSGAPAGAVLYTQVLTLPPPGTNPNTAKLTNIATTLILL